MCNLRGPNHSCAPLLRASGLLYKIEVGIPRLWIWGNIPTPIVAASSAPPHQTQLEPHLHKHPTYKAPAAHCSSFVIMAQTYYRTFSIYFVNHTSQDNYYGFFATTPLVSKGAEVCAGAGRGAGGRAGAGAGRGGGRGRPPD